MQAGSLAQADPLARVGSSRLWTAFQPTVLACASAVLLWMAFPPLDRGHLGWIAMVPLWIAARTTQGRGPLYLGSWVGGLLFWHLAVSWIRLTDPSAWLAWVTMAGVLSLGWPLTILIIRLGIRGAGWPLWLAAPVAVLVEEYYRSFMLTGFPWYYLAHTQSRALPLIQLSDLTGAWGVSVLVAIVNAALVDAIVFLRDRETRIASGQRWPWGGPVVALSLLALTLGYGLLRISQADFSKGPRLALLQSNIKQELKMGAEAPVILAEFQKLIMDSLERQPDLIVWPETSYPRGYPQIDPLTPEDALAGQIRSIHPDGTIAYWRLRDEVVRSELHGWTDDIGIPMLVGSTTYDFRPQKLTRYNSAILVRPGDPRTTRYDKLHLVPFGEYVPLIRTMPWLTRLTPYDGTFVPKLEPGATPTVFNLNGVRIANAICFEDTVPRVVRRSFQATAPDAQPDLLVNISNDGWFRGSSELDMHRAICVFRAVENRVPVARAVNTGGSSLIDGNGRILSSLPRLKAAPLVVDVPLDPRQALYSVTGDWLPRVALLACGILVVQATRRRKTQQIY